MSSSTKTNKKKVKVSLSELNFETETGLKQETDETFFVVYLVDFDV